MGKERRHVLLTSFLTGMAVVLRRRGRDGDESEERAV